MIAPPTIALRVRDAEILAPTLKRLRLEAADGGWLPPSAAGSHLVLTLKGADRTWRNAYSVVSAPGERRAYEIIVRRTCASRGGSAFLHERVGEGDVLPSAPPHNLFPLSITARKHVLIGGGIGVTPLLAHLAALRASGAAFEAHQIAAPAEVMVFEHLLAPFAGPSTHVHAGRAACDLAAILARQPLGSHLYVCGPAPLMETVAETAARLGWPHTAVHHESFGDHRGGAPFAATLARSGKEIAVGPDQSLLEAIEAAGVEAPYLCRGGACGQCMTAVLDGEPDHRDDVLTPQERASGALIMTCVSRARSPRLVLDL
jgi:ferredoxin-NADP reductase